MKKLLYMMLFICTGIILVSTVAFSDEFPDPGELTEFNTDEFLRGIGEEGADSNRLNTIGFYAYQEGDLYRAVKLWRCAVDKDERNAWAHYNLACAYALCGEEFGRDPAEIVPELEWGDPEVDRLLEFAALALFHLKRAVFYNGEIWHRMQEDADLNLIRNMREYDFIFLYPDNDPARLLEIIETWYGANYGVYPGGTISFFDGEVTVERLVFDEESNPAWVIETGHYTLEGRQLFIDLNQPESRRLTGELVIDYDDFGFIRSMYLTIDGNSYSSTPDYSA
jgi:hypothetical protein